MNCDEVTPARFLQVPESKIKKKTVKKSQPKPSESNVSDDELEQSEEEFLNDDKVVPEIPDAEHLSVFFSLENLEFTEQSSSIQMHFL